MIIMYEKWQCSIIEVDMVQRMRYAFMRYNIATADAQNWSVGGRSTTIYNRKAVAFRQLLIRKTSESVPVEESQVQSFKYHLILVRILDFMPILNEL